MDFGSGTRSLISIVIVMLEAEAKNDLRTLRTLPKLVIIILLTILSHLKSFLRLWVTSEVAEAVLL